jgi:hypothetical protein
MQRSFRGIGFLVDISSFTSSTSDSLSSPPASSSCLFFMIHIRVSMAFQPLELVAHCLDHLFPTERSEIDALVVDLVGTHHSLVKRLALNNWSVDKTKQGAKMTGANKML